MHRRTVLTTSLFALFVAAIVVSAHAQMSAALVRVDAVRTEPLSQTVPVLGRLVTQRASEVAARIAGPVLVMHVEVGTRLQQGDLIAELDAEPLRAAREVAAARLGEARARLATSKAELVLAGQERDRLEQLKDVSSKSLIEDARQNQKIANARVKEAEAGLVSANAALRVADIDLAYTRLVAPYAGVVTTRYVDIGGYVQTGDPVVRLVSDQALEVEADVPFARLGGLQPGTRVSVALDDGSTHFARVRAIVPEENRLTRTRRIRFTPELGTTRLALAVDQTATLHLPVGPSREVLSVHKDAVNKRGGGNLVFVVVDETAQPRMVSLGQAFGNRFVVLDGLADGDMAVVRGNERLQPNEKVRIAADS